MSAPDSAFNAFTRLMRGDHEARVVPSEYPVTPSKFDMIRIKAPRVVGIRARTDCDMLGGGDDNASEKWTGDVILRRYNVKPAH